MPLGHNQYGPYGYFDIPTAMGGYEDALMGLAGAQRGAQRMQFPDFMRQLSDMLLQWQGRRQEQGRWQQEFDVTKDYREALGDLYRQQAGLAREKFEYAKDQPPGIGTPFQEWRRRNPDVPISEWYKMQEDIKAKPTTPGGYAVTREKRLQKQEDRLYGLEKEWRTYWQDIKRRWKEREEKESRIIPMPDRTSIFREWGRDLPVQERVALMQRIGTPPKTPTQKGVAQPTVPEKFQTVFKGFSTKQEALTDALANFRRGEINRITYENIIKWANLYYGE